MGQLLQFLICWLLHHGLVFLSFGRKNIGYLYAIANGAAVIWDFDDDNILKFWIKGASPDDFLEIDHFIENLTGKLFWTLLMTAF